jgi:hypothetical protein
MNPHTGGTWVLACPVCSRPVTGPGAAPCPTCGLPGAGSAALVVARIGTTLDELARDRDALLATLRAAAHGAARPQPASPAATPPFAPPAPAQAPLPPPLFPPPAVPAAASPPRGISPQQVLLGLGALLVVAAAITFVAVAWTRFGLAFQAGVMLVVTGSMCAFSAWVAHRGLRATEEALAAAGAALLAVDLGAARALGLFGLEDVSLRLWSACSCAVVVTAGVLLGRLTRSTATWPLAALLAAQPVAFLLLPVDLLTGPVGVAVALTVAGADMVAVRRLRRELAPVAYVLAGLWTTIGVLGGLVAAGGSDVRDSWTATAVLAAGGATALVLTRAPGAGGVLLPRPAIVAGGAGAVVGLALAGSLRTLGDPGPIVAAVTGLALLTAAVLVARPPVPAAVLTASGGALATAGVWLLADAERLGPLALVVLAATVPAALAAVRLPALRPSATAAALLAAGSSALLARADGALPAGTAGLLLALLAATAFALAALRAGHPEEWVCASGGAVAGLAAALTTGAVQAWGQVGLQLAVAGTAAGCYALVARRPPVAALAVADLVVASWTAVAGAGVQTPEAYTLPAAAGLFLIALPRLRAGAPSWAVEGAAVGVALAPSALVVVATPTALRLVLVVAGAAALTVLGTLTHRQAPFVLGTAALAVVVVGRLTPYAPLLPRWVTLATVGLLLLILGATYERRRQQAREAVAWIAQMR